MLLSDKDVMIMALQKERDNLHERIMQVDRIMSRIRNIDYNMENLDTSLVPLDKPNVPVNISNDNKEIVFPTSADIKIQVLRIFDIVGQAAELSKLQAEYTSITGSSYKIREVVRSLHASGIVKMLKYKNASRGFMWLKKEWIESGQLLEKHKPLGFDLLYTKENLMFV